MKFSIKWLNEYVDISDIKLQELIDKLTLNSFEVESVECQGENLKHIVVARIESVEKHPNADSLQVCQANIGDKTLQILTRATNVFPGAYVPLALDGAILPNGTEIKPTKMRGLDSLGMFCGRDEIGLEKEDNDDGIYILDKAYPLGCDIAKVIGKDDYILDVTILSNRPDCNSIYFFAKEVGAIFNRKVKNLPLTYNENTNVKKDIKVIINSKNCLNYEAVVVDDIKNVQSPKWMKERLASVGIRSINAIVDITNYVLIEVGQPMHAFDYDKIKSATINVRQAKNGDKFVALNEQEYTLDENVMVISDSVDAMALGGVMGGIDTGVTDSTKTIVFESASFARGSIRSTVRTLGLSSDSSARFERGVVPYLNEIGLKRALNLINELNIGKISSNIVSVKNYTKKDNSVVCKLANINRQLGLNLSFEEIKNILAKLDFVTIKINNEEFKCLYPEYRNDIFGEQDIAEEIVRLYGFDKIKSTLMQNAHYSIQFPNEKYLRQEKVSTLLTNIGLNEAISLVLENKTVQKQLLCDEENLVVINNPLSSDLQVLRKNAIASLLNAVKYNNSHSNKNLSLYEVGKEYSLVDGKYLEKDVLTLCLSAKKPNFFTIKGWCEMIADIFNTKFEYKQDVALPYLNTYQSASIWCCGKQIGYIGAIHPRVIKNFDLTENVIVACIDYINIKSDDSLHEVKAYSKYQPIVRDFTFLVPNDMEYEKLYNEIKNSSGKYCIDISLKDVYTGENVQEGYKSMTFELVYEKLEGTFTDEEMTSITSKLLKALKYKLNINLKDEV